MIVPGFSVGSLCAWVAFVASLFAGLSFLGATHGREDLWRIGKRSYLVAVLGMAGGAAWLWHILFTHQFQYQYVANYSSRSMPGHYVYAAFWGGQEGTFLLWGLISGILGLVVMRMRHSLIPAVLFFLNVPIVLLMLITVVRGPFLMFPPGQIPADGAGLNPLLQDPWMTIHPPVLFTGFSSLVVPFAFALAGLAKRDYDGWIKPGLPWIVFSTGILATGFTMGGVWAYKVLGWGGYWGWDPVENGSLIPWLSNTALLHGVLVQRVNGSLRRTNFFLAITSYVLVLYASFLTRSGVLADFSVHSFVNLGLNGFLLAFLFCAAILGYGLLVVRLRDIPHPARPLGNFSRESMMWLGQLVFMLMCALTAVGMSAPLITRLFGPPSNVQTSYYNLVNAPLGISLCLLLGVAPLMRWREQDARAFFTAALPAVVVGAAVALIAAIAGVRQPLQAGLVFSAGFGLAANAWVALRGFRAGWKHGIAYTGHLGATLLIIGVVASSGYGRSVQVQLPEGQDRTALGMRMRFEGVRPQPDGKDRVAIAVASPERKFEARPRLYFSQFNQGMMKNPHIERFALYDIYISPLEMVGDEGSERALWLAKGESKTVGEWTYTFVDFDRQMGQVIRVAARLRARRANGTEVPVRPQIEVAQGGSPNRIPDYLPGGGSVMIAGVDAANGRVGLEVPGLSGMRQSSILAVEVSTKPLINFVWLGAIVMLGSVFLSVARRWLDLGPRASPHAAKAPAGAVRGPVPQEGSALGR